MPIYEFHCSDCDTSFDKLVRITENYGDIQCSHCSSPNVKKKLSLFSSRINAPGGSASASPSCSPGGL